MSDLSAVFDAIRRHYREVGPAIMACPSDEWAIGAYAWDCAGTGIRLSPIEQNLWCDIRQQDMVMYPQYPVGRYFVDFGNPVAKVAIECDGRAYHLDRAKDAARQRDLEAMGWRVYRISGAACNKDEVVTEDEDGREVVTSSPAWQFIKRIGQNHPVCRGRSRNGEPGAGHVRGALANCLEAILNG